MMLRTLPAPGAVTADRGAAEGAAPSMTQSQCPGLPQPCVPGRPLLVTTSKPRGELGLKQSFQSNYSKLAVLTHLQVSASLWESTPPRASAGVQEAHFLPGFPRDTAFSPVPWALRRPRKSAGSARVTRHQARTGNIPRHVASPASQETAE